MKKVSYRILGLVYFSAVMCLLLVHKRAEITWARYQIGRMEREMVQLDKQGQELLLEVSLLKSPHIIASKLQEMNLGLVDPLALERALYLARKQKRQYKVAMRPGH